MKKRRGASTLILVVGTFAVLIVLGAIISSYAMNNSLLSRLQKERIQAYYLVMSGIELATDALLESEVDDDTGQLVSLLTEFADDPYRGTLTHEIDNMEELFGSEIDFKGNIKIAISAVNSKGAPWSADDDESGEVWVEIFVTSQVITARENTHYTGKVRMSTNDPANAVWEVDLPDSFDEKAGA